MAIKIKDFVIAPGTEASPVILANTREGYREVVVGDNGYTLDAYIVVMDVARRKRGPGGPVYATATPVVYEEVEEALQQVTVLPAVTCELDTSGDAPELTTQVYAHLKTLEAFSGAEDC